MTIRLGLLSAVLLAFPATMNVSRLAKAADDRGPVLRRTNYLAVLSEPSGQPCIVLQSQQYSSIYSDVLNFVLTGPDSSTLATGEVPLGEEFTLSLPEGVGGLHVLELDSGWNACRAASGETPSAFVAREVVPLSTARGVDQFFFYVPRGCKEFSVWLVADAPREGTRIQITGPDGVAVVEEEGDYDKPQRIRARVAAGADGKVWSLSLLKPIAGGWNLDDVKLWLDPALPPYLALRKDWALIFGKRQHP